MEKNWLNKCSITLFPKQLEKLKNYITVNFQILIYHLNCPTKDIDFNDIINAETVFNNIKSKK